MLLRLLWEVPESAGGFMSIDAPPTLGNCEVRVDQGLRAAHPIGSS